jgi:pyruvate dehydrogenase E2 component (dihydrolipoamide acetyltransferase)
MTPFTEVLSPQGNFGPARLENGTLTTPYARRLASELNLRLSDIDGSGPQGRIVGKDVVPLPRAGSGAAIKAQYDATRFTGQPVDSMRAAIARRLTESKQTIPHFYLTIDVAVGALSRRREALNGAAGARDSADTARVSLNDLLVEAWAAALNAVPAANAVWANGEILVFSHVDVGIAVALENGLVTPVIRDADTKSATEIAREMKDLASRARARKLKQDELRGGVSTISNLGMHGIREFAAIINPPQSTILAVGASQRRPIEGPNGSVHFASMMTVTLACDHRVVDGVLGAILLAAFRERVERFR